MGIFLEKTELKDSYAESEKWTEDWQKPFDEYERIAGNKISKALSKNMPKVNDGSLAAALLETPMQVLPAMQTGKFTSTNKKNAWLNEIANIIWKDRIVPNANTQSSFFSKEQISLYRAIRYGAQPRYNFFVSTEKYTGSDWSLPNIKNVKLEPGKYSVDDSDYVFLDVYYTKLGLKKLIDSQKEEAKKIRKENKQETELAAIEGREPVLQEVDTTWNIKSLQKLADMAMTSKEIKEQNINEKSKQVHASGIKTTICFNRGVDAPFYMFSKHLEEGETIREWTNPDPTGDLPITMQYCFETLEDPYGIGRVMLAGPTQNVLDFFTQAHVLATQVGIQPPKKFKGAIENANLNSFVFAPDALWLPGANNDVEVVQTTNSVYSQFSTNYGLYKSQLMNLQGRTDGSVSATSGNPEFSKTPAGVSYQKDRTNTQDNHLRNMADTASAKMATKMMNIHMAKMQGADILDIAEEDRERLEKAGYFNDNPADDIPSINEIEILYEELRDTFNFEFDSRPEADEDEKNRMVEIFELVTTNPNAIPILESQGWKLDLGQILLAIITNSGSTNGDKILTKIDPEKMAAGAEDGAGGQASTEQVQAIMDKYQIDEQMALVVIKGIGKGYDPDAIVNYLLNGEQASDQESEAING